MVIDKRIALKYNNPLNGKVFTKSSYFIHKNPLISLNISK